AHHGGKAPVKIAETPRDFIAAYRVKIVLHPMRAPIGVKSGFEKKARRCDNSKDAEHEVRSRSFGKVCNIAQVIRFLSKRVNHDLPKTLKIRKRYPDLPLLSPCAGGRYGGIRHIRQRENGRPSKMNSGGGNPNHSDNKQSKGKPFSSGEKI